MPAPRRPALSAPSESTTLSRRPRPDPRRCGAQRKERATVTLCPVALVSGCKSCAIFQMCPLKGVIGDYKKDEDPRTTGGKPPSPPPQL
jgi:hypothetical protein